MKLFAPCEASGHEFSASKIRNAQLSRSRAIATEPRDLAMIVPILDPRIGIAG
jgi:hypothetical protein